MSAPVLPTVQRIEALAAHFQLWMTQASAPPTDDTAKFDTLNALVSEAKELLEITTQSETMHYALFLRVRRALRVPSCFPSKDTQRIRPSRALSLPLCRTFCP
jgi:hypothetical protein